MSLTVFPISVEKKENEFDLFDITSKSIEKNGHSIIEGDVIASVRTSNQSNILSKKFRLNPQFAEVIIRESDKIFGGIAGFVISSSDNILAPNAGIDKSNAKKGKIILYPFDPYLVAEQLRRKFFLKYLIHVGIIIVDSRLMPSRVGTTGVAISCSGIEPILDMRAQTDLEGIPLKVTFQAVVDNLASIANHKMGEGSESQPISIIRDSGARLTDRKINPTEVAVSDEQCVYVRGLKNT
jgi:coenzyme F420-0:L-glutamate ligase / coenzyme F420-1:gamma-L-glutamate ligase